MSKVLLNNALQASVDNNYVWTMYFFKIDRRNTTQPFTSYKIRFKNRDYLPNYVSELVSNIINFQIQPITDVQLYDGINTKVSCDKISLSNTLIEEQWAAFSESINNASDEKLKGKVNGYIVCGQPIEDDGTLSPIMYVKIANPSFTLNNKRSVVYKETVENELDTISDTLYRFYLTSDFVVHNETLYTFNHNFEKMFNMEKTMQKVKLQSIEQIILTKVFADDEQFKVYASQYKSPRTFITLNEKRLQRIQNANSRKSIAKKFNLDLDENSNFIINDLETASLLIKYLCYKIFFDDETKDILEASSVIKLEIG